MNNSQALRLLRERGLRPKKSFGQNFLTAEPLCDRIAELALPQADQQSGVVLEIGAGVGALTAALLPRTQRLVAIERDRDLMPILQERFAEASTLELHEADAVRLPWWPLLEQGSGPRVVCGNLPYQLTGRLLRKLTELADRIDRGVVMVQREVAERLSATPSSSQYSALTVFINAAFRVERGLKVGKGAFTPSPKVDSMVMVLTPLRPPRAKETALFQLLVKSAFSQRRKRLSNSLKAVTRDRDKLQAAATLANVDLEARAETLSVEQFAALCHHLGALNAEAPAADDEKRER